MSDYLMVSANARGEALWFDEWLNMNRGGVHTARMSTRTVTMYTGDVFRFVVLSPAILSMEVDAVFFNDRAFGRLTPEQEDWLRVLPTRVRPKSTGAPVTTVSVAGCDIEGNPVTPWVTATRRGALGNVEASDITVDVDTVVSGFVCSDGSRCFFAHPTILVPKDSIRLNHNVGKKPPAD